MKKAIAFAMAMMIGTVLLSGCGATVENAADSQTTQENAAVQADSAEEAEVTDDITEIKLVLMSQGVVAGWDEVEAKINEISTREIGVKIDVDWIEIGAWAQQMNLRLAAGDEMDLIMLTPMMSFENLRSVDQLMDITDELQEYGQDILSIDSVYLPSTTVDGRIYGIPNNFVKGGLACIDMREDVLEELGLLEKAEAMNSFSELEEILLAVNENTDLTPMFVTGQNGFGLTVLGSIDASSDSFDDIKALESLGDPYSMIFADPETDEVFCYYTTDSFRKDCERAAKFYSEGLMLADGANSSEPSITLFQANTLFAHVNVSEPPKDREAMKNQYGYYLTGKELASIPVTRSKANMWGMAVPYTSSNPEEAVAFINLLFTNEEAANLMLWGIEGRDYTMIGEGKVQVNQDAAFRNMPFFTPNSLICYDSMSGIENYSEEVKAAYDNQAYSKYMSFFCDNEPVQNALTACYSAKMEYVPALLCGSTTDWESALDSFVQKLKDNGIDDVVAFYQEQLDAWIAE